MNITDIAKRIAEKHYPNLPTAPCGNAYRDGRMNELRKLIEGELKNCSIPDVRLSLPDAKQEVAELYDKENW